MTGTSGGQPCVLLVDDSQVQRDGLAELLPELGIHVAAAVDRGEAALPAITQALAAGARVDVVLMDVRMPGIGGLEATRRIKAAHPDVQVLLYSAFAGHLETQAGQIGAFAEIPKGIGVTDLVDAIWHAYRSAPVRTSATLL